MHPPRQRYNPPLPIFAPADLRHLKLTPGKLDAIPAALGSATALTSLSLDANFVLRLSEAGVETLCMLPRLQELGLVLTEAGDGDSALLQLLQQRLPALHVDLGKNQADLSSSSDDEYD